MKQILIALTFLFVALNSNPLFAQDGPGTQSTVDTETVKKRNQIEYEEN